MARNRRSVDAAFEEFTSFISSRLPPQEELRVRRKNERLSAAYDRVERLASTDQGAKAVVDALIERPDEDG